jgi:hypothetical protein
MPYDPYIPGFNCRVITVRVGKHQRAAGEDPGDRRGHGGGGAQEGFRSRVAAPKAGSYFMGGQGGSLE